MEASSTAALLSGLGVSTGGAVTDGEATPSAFVGEREDYLEDPRVVKENQDEAHVPLAPYPSVESVHGLLESAPTLSDRLRRSPYHRSLNGKWNFKYALSPSGVPDSPEAVDEWEQIRVPSPWQAEGYGHPMYRNIPLDLYPYDPPKVPDDINPVGMYRREFTVPDNWSDRRTFLRFQGVKSAYFVWVNGEYVGYDEGSMTPGEFDVTPHTSTGTNTVTVQVFRWSDGSYLENQDMWHFAGIYRDVSVYSTPQVSIQDYFTRTYLGENYDDARLRIDAVLENATETAVGPHTVRAHLFDPDGGEVATFEASEPVGANDSDSVELTTQLTGPALWSAEDPNLYELALELVTPDGTTTEVLAGHVGFREVEVRDNEIHVNGEAVAFKGVNRHEHHPELGRTMPEETIHEDMELMKRNNVNAIRTSHYPNTPDFYYLADVYGFYVMDEVNAETHQNPDLVEDYPAFRPSFLDRFTRMLQRDKNHPSIWSWSTGNEAGLGPAHFEMAEYANRVDDTRILYHQSNVPDGRAPYASVIGPRYPSPEALKGAAMDDEETRPAVMGEYNHAMGNSLGLVHRFWQLIREYDQLQGGFIWDWVNQSLEHDLRTTPDRSGQGNDGTLMNNPDVVAGRSGEGNALALSGLDDWVEMYRDPSLDITEPGLTLETVVKPREPWTAANPFLTKGNQQYALKQPDQDTLQFFVYDPDADTWVTANAPVPDDWTETWHHLAGTYDGSALRLYVDGEEVASTEYSGEIKSVPFPVNVGRNAELHGSDYNGWLSNAVYDRAAVYTRALSAEELRADRTAPADEAVLWLDFEEYRDEGEFTDYGVSTFCCNGLVFADREEQPELSQLKHSHQPVVYEAADLTAGQVTITNEHEFTDLSAYETRWQLSADDEVVREGTVDLELPPEESTLVSLPYDDVKPEPGVDYWLTVSTHLTADTWWADAGHEVAFEQFKVPFEHEEPPLFGLEEMGTVSLRRADDLIVLSGDEFRYVLDTDVGTLTSMCLHGDEYVQEGPLLNVWRTPISNERVNWGTAEAEEWRDVGLNDLRHRVTELSVERLGESVVRIRVETTVSAPEEEAGFQTEYLYHVLGSGDVLLGVRAVPNDALQTAISNWLPRVGLQMETVDAFDRFSWYGRGPEENYPDRKWGSRVDVYEQAVEDQYVPYVRPQAHGNRTQVRWAAVSNDDAGLAAFAHPEMHASAHRFGNLDRALYNHQLRELDGVRLNLDHAVTGVGGTPVQTLPEYRVLPDDAFEFVIGLRPFGGDADLTAMSHRRLPFAFAAADTYGDQEIELVKETIEAAATVRNTTTDETTLTVPLAVDGETVKSREVTLAGGEKRRVSFEYPVDATGVWEVSVGDMPTELVVNPQLNLAGEWHFHEGDDPTWKRTGLDTNGWQTVDVPNSWENHSDYTKNPAYGWYRKTVEIPASWEGYDVRLSLGRIDDVDETFVNGEKVGETGSFPGDENGYVAAWSETREYTVPSELIDYGGQNVIAVRAYDGGGNGGLVAGPLGAVPTLPDGRGGASEE